MALAVREGNFIVFLAADYISLFATRNTKLPIVIRRCNHIRYYTCSCRLQKCNYRLKFVYVPIDN